MIYLASPYSSVRPETQVKRYEAALRRVAELTIAGHIVYSPIVHWHPVVSTYYLGDYHFWQCHAKHMLSRSDALWVLDLPGWKQSRGVLAEIAYAKTLMLPIKHLTP